MADQFVAEIRMFGGNFAPSGWASCDGQLMPISQNTALFSLLGTNYGGDGKSTFGLPNLRGSMAIGSGQGPGLSDRFVGEIAGEATVTLLATEMPQHGHGAQGSLAGGTNTPTGNNWGESKLGKTALNVYAASGAANVAMNPLALSLVGSSLPHNNMPPYQCLFFIIALQGIFPPRS